MKTRVSFVANSSSSSFIVVYKDIPTIHEIFETGIIPDELKGKIELFGGYLSEGEDNIYLTEEIIQAYNINRANLRSCYIGNFIEVIDRIEDESIIKPEYIGCHMMASEVDYHSTKDNLNLFLSRWVRD